MDELTPDQLGHLADHLTGNTDSETDEAVKRWFSENEELGGFFRRLEDARNTPLNELAVQDARSPGRVEEILKNLSERGVPIRTDSISAATVASESAGTTSASQKLRSKPGSASYVNQNLARAGRAFSVITLSAMLLFTGWFYGKSSSAPPSGSRVFTYVTGKGEQATVRLPDGSSVILNVASQLDVPVDYDAGNRSLKLSGQAFFSVEQSASTPFTVIAGASRTQVLGTRFSVRNYDEDTAAIVAVQDGKVSVNSLVVTADQKAIVPSRGIAHVESQDLTEYTFAQGIMTLEYKPLISAIPDLNRWYNVDIRIGDAELANKGVLGQFAVGSVTDLVEILEMILEIRIERADRVLTLYKR